MNDQKRDRSDDRSPGHSESQPGDRLDSHLKQLRHLPDCCRPNYSLNYGQPEDRRTDKSRHHSDELFEHRTGHHMDHCADHWTDHLTEYRTDHSSDHSIDHSTDHSTGHLKDHPTDQSTDHSTFRHRISSPNRTSSSVKLLLFLRLLQLLDHLNAHLFKRFASAGHKRSHRNAISLFLLVLLGSTVTGAQHSACPNAKQINDLKPPNVNLNCDCTQTADGQKAAGWEIMCYSVENLHNGECFWGG